MGLFDYLKCECPMAPPNEHGELIIWHSRQNHFDGSDFDCLLAEHRIPRRSKMLPCSEPEED